MFAVKIKIEGITQLSVSVSSNIRMSFKYLEHGT